MLILELFCGTKSFSNVAEKRKHKCFTIDIKENFNPSLCMDIMEFDIDKIPKEFQRPDVIWASPPCIEYSHAKRRGVRKIDEANAKNRQEYGLTVTLGNQDQFVKRIVVLSRMGNILFLLEMPERNILQKLCPKKTNTDYHLNYV